MFTFLKRVAFWLVGALRRLLGLAPSKPPRHEPPLPEPPTLRPSRPLDPAPARPSPFDSPPFDSPAIVAMERRALRQIFDELDLDMTPGWAFTALEQTRDPVTAFKWFAAWVAVDPLAARDRNVAAITRLNLAIELLRELNPLRSLLTDEGERRIFNALRDTTGADPLSRLRDQMMRVAGAAELHRIGTRLEELPRCALFSKHIKPKIAEVAADPLATLRSDVDEGVTVAKRLETALKTFKGADTQVSECLEALRAAFRSGALSDRHAVWCDEQADAFERLSDDIETDDTLGVIGIEERVKQAEAVRDGLHTMRNSAGGHRPPPKTPEDESNEALAVLGLAPPVDWTAIVQRRKALWRKHNTDDPDHRATRELERKNTERMQAINNAMDVLKKYRDKF